ncbi:MAG: integrase [Candidatus Melainabacteria bacterium RIFOXYA12_FULL_32_12]|nr:MAG: integrase [Candidatus Melainabacteria bacterium RIFOXYA12_FULL_32_12]
MATIQQRKRKNGKSTYTVTIRMKGRPNETATFDRITDAKEWAKDTESAIKQSRYFKTSESRKHTLADLIDRYIENELPQRKSDRQKFAMQLNWWKKHIGAYFPSDITPALLAEYRDKLQKEPIRYIETESRKKEPIYRSNATVNRYMAALSIAFTIATNEWGWLEDNPMRKVKKKTEPRGRIRFLSEEERKALLKACQKVDNPYLYPVVVLALSTGGRFSEIMNLKWQDVDFERCRLIFMDTKNGENRAAPLSKFPLEVLKKHSKIRKINSPYVFSRADGKAPMEIRKHWYKAINDAGITDFKFHDLRHTAASYLAMNGASLLEIGQILGHKSQEMTKRYAHLTEQHTAGVLERMNEKQFFTNN